MHAVIYIVLSLFTDLKLERIIGLLNLEITHYYYNSKTRCDRQK